MVGNNNIESHTTGLLNLGQARNPAVDGDDQTHAFLTELPEDIIPQAVTLTESTRYIGNYPALKNTQTLDEECCCCNAIGIKVTVDSDAFSREECTVNPAHCLVHVREQKRVGSQPLISSDERFQLGQVGKPAVKSQLGYQWR